MMLNSQWFIASIWDSMISMISYPASFHGYFCNCLGLPPLVAKVVIPVARARCCCGGHRMWRGPCHSQRSGYQRGPKKWPVWVNTSMAYGVLLYIFQSKTNYLADIPSFFGYIFTFCMISIMDSVWHDLCFFSERRCWPTPKTTGDLRNQDAVDGSGKGSLLVRLNPVHCKAPDCRFHIGFTTCKKLDVEQRGDSSDVIQVCRIWNEPVGESFRAGGISVSASKKNTIFFSF